MEDRCNLGRLSLKRASTEDLSHLASTPKRSFRVELPNERHPPADQNGKEVLAIRCERNRANGYGVKTELNQVVGLLDSSPAAAAGLLVGDVITHVDGRAHGNDEDVRTQMLHKPSVWLTIERVSRPVGLESPNSEGGNRETESKSAVAAHDQLQEGERLVALRFPNAAKGGRLGINLTKDSHTIVSILPSSPADKAGLLPGDVILAIDGRELDERGLRVHVVGKKMTRCVLKVRRKTISAGATDRTRQQVTLSDSRMSGAVLSGNL